MWPYSTLVASSDVKLTTGLGFETIGSSVSSRGAVTSPVWKREVEKRERKDRSDKLTINCL